MENITGAVFKCEAYTFDHRIALILGSLNGVVAHLPFESALIEKVKGTCTCNPENQRIFSPKQKKTHQQVAARTDEPLREFVSIIALVANPTGISSTSITEIGRCCIRQFRVCTVAAPRSRPRKKKTKGQKGIQ